MMNALRSAALLVLAASAGCTAYEYEEEVFLGVDGSGRIRVSGSRELMAAMHRIENAGIDSARTGFEGDGAEIVSVRETERDGRKFLHVQMSFADWNALCRHPRFRERGCRLVIGGDELQLQLSVPAPTGPAPDVEPDAVTALRFHFPSTVHYHNAPSEIERGNILSWERTVRELFAGAPLEVDVRFDERSTLATSLRILLLAVGIVAASAAGAFYAMARKGRRQLAADVIEERASFRDASSPPPRDRP